MHEPDLEFMFSNYSLSGYLDFDFKSLKNDFTYHWLPVSVAGGSGYVGGKIKVRGTKIKVTTSRYKKKVINKQSEKR